MSYKLYTIGQSGDNFYLELEKAKCELDRRKIMGNNDCILQELNYYSSFSGNDSVITTSYYFNNHYFKHGYTIVNDECYGCDIDGVNEVEWLSSKEQLPMVYNWYLGFEQMYPELKGVDLTDTLNELEKEANEWIKYILSYDGIDSLDDGIRKFCLNQNMASIVRLGYAESCYLIGNIKEGDKYLQRVDLTLSQLFDEKLDVYFKEVLELRNRRFKEEKAIILTRFKNY